VNEKLSRQFFDFGYVLQTVGHVPLNVKSQSWTRPSQGMHLRGVAEFFFDGGGGSGLNKLPKASASVGKSPRRQLNVEFVERLPNEFDRTIIHD
jgi:hypothetical protein